MSRHSGCQTQLSWRVETRAEFLDDPMGSGYKQAVLESEEGTDKPIGLYRKFLYTGKYRKSRSKDNKILGRSKQGREMSSHFLPRQQVYTQFFSFAIL